MLLYVLPQDSRKRKQRGSALLPHSEIAVVLGLEQTRPDEKGGDVYAALKRSIYIRMTDKINRVLLTYPKFVQFLPCSIS